MRTEKDLWIEMSIREISTQATFAEVSFFHLDPKVADLNTALFSSIHSFLSHCGMVSKMLRSTDDSTPPQSIGDVLGISTNSLIHQRIFRNHLEHYDERLKEWIRTFGPNINIATYNVGPKSAFNIPNMVFVSHYDHDTHTFTFVNDEFNLELMYQDVVRIRKIADKWVGHLRHQV